MAMFCNMSDSRFFELKALLRESIARQGRILYRQEILMSKISEFAAAQNAYNDRADAAVAGIQSSVSGVQGDVTAMKELIEKLQNSPGELTPEDQKTLDELSARSGPAVDKLEAAASALKALDEMTPPPPPAG